MRSRSILSAIARVISVGVLVNFTSTAMADTMSEIASAEAALKSGDFASSYSGYLEAAEERNNHVAQFTLALFHQLGWGRDVDAAEACRWFEKAANGGIPVAQHEYANCLRVGLNQHPDHAKAAEWYEKAVASGHSLSSCYLAKMLMAGDGVPKDPKKGLEICQSAAERNSPPAQTMMGLLLLDGDESVRNPAAAVPWFRLAAQGGDSRAQYHLGIMLRDGHGVATDTEAALFMFESAAAQGYLDAYSPTASLYYAEIARADDSNVELILAKAYLWLSAALHQLGDTDEAALIGTMLDDVRAAIPPQWIGDLDAKVAHHLDLYSKY